MIDSYILDCWYEDAKKGKASRMLTLIETLRTTDKRLKSAEGALEIISKEHQTYYEQGDGEYDKGVVDGHRCAAVKAREHFARWENEK